MHLKGWWPNFRGRVIYGDEILEYGTNRFVDSVFKGVRSGSMWKLWKEDGKDMSDGGWKGAYVCLKWKILQENSSNQEILGLLY
jgi:hypothetical protein